MLVTTIVGVWLVQAPVVLPAPVLPAGVPFTPSVKEWSLGGAFVLKQEKFLQWRPAYDLVRGWYAEPRPTWLLELAPTNRHLSRLSLAVESNPASAAGAIGFVRPRLQVRVAEQTRVGVELPVAMLVNTASGIGPRVFRPFAFISGRF